jgi:DNA gyrase subunit A
MPPGSEAVAGVVLPAHGAAGYLVFGTLQGMVKRTEVEALPGPSGRTFQAIKLNEGDRLGWVRWSAGKSDLVLVSSAGLAIRFSEEEVRPVGLTAAGVMGMRLAAKERLVGTDLAAQGSELLLVAANGLAKRTPLAQFQRQGRHGKGIRAWKAGAALAGAAVGDLSDHGVILPARGAGKSVRLEDIPRRARAAAGAKVVEVKANDRVAAVVVAIRRPEIEPPAPEAKRKKTKRAAPPAKRRGKPPAKSRTPSAPARKPVAKRGPKPSVKKPRKKKS